METTSLTKPRGEAKHLHYEHTRDVAPHLAIAHMTRPNLCKMPAIANMARPSPCKVVQTSMSSCPSAISPKAGQMSARLQGREPRCRATRAPMHNILNLRTAVLANLCEQCGVGGGH